MATINSRKKTKQPKFGKQPPTKKHVRRKEDPAFHEDLPVAWRFSTVDRDGPFAWKVPSEHLSMILDTLSSLETMPRSEWVQQRSHQIPIYKLSKTAQDRLEGIQQDDIDEIWSLRMTGRCRVFAKQDGHIMRILWYDPEHQVCVSKLKNT